MPLKPDASALRAAGWIHARDAADLLGVGPGQVSYLTRTGRLPTFRQVGQQRWLLRSEVEDQVEERARWVSYVDAAVIIGCSTTTVSKLVQDGRFDQRSAGTTAVASLGRESVERVARERADAAAEARERRQARNPSAAPDDGHEWLSVRQAAELLWLSPNGLRWLAENDRVPAIRRGARWWFRRDQALLVANARAARGLQA